MGLRDRDAHGVRDQGEKLYLFTPECYRAISAYNVTHDARQMSANAEEIFDFVLLESQTAGDYIASRWGTGCPELQPDGTCWWGRAYGNRIILPQLTSRSFPPTAMTKLLLHEVMHVTLGSHISVADVLGISHNGTDKSASDAINSWIDRCYD